MSAPSVDEPAQRELSQADVDELPPSAKLVLQSLHRSDGLTTAQLAEEVQLAERTIRYALNRLDDLGVVESRYLLVDPQTCKYELTCDESRLEALLDRS